MVGEKAHIFKFNMQRCCSQCWKIYQKCSITKLIFVLLKLISFNFLGIILHKKIHFLPTKSNFEKWDFFDDFKTLLKLMAFLNQLRTAVSSYAIQENKNVCSTTKKHFSSSDAISSKNARERVVLRQLFFLSSSISSLKWLFSFSVAI